MNQPIQPLPRLAPAPQQVPQGVLLQNLLGGTGVINGQPVVLVGLQTVTGMFFFHMPADQVDNFCASIKQFASGLVIPG